MMKLIVAQDSQRVVGIHMVGLDAPEIIQGMAVALKAGAPKQVFDATVGIHPTAAEEFVPMRAPPPGDPAKAEEKGLTRISAMSPTDSAARRVSGYHPTTERT